MLITRRSQVRDLHGPALNFCFFSFFNSILFNFYLYLLSILYHVDSFIYPLFSTVVFSLYCFLFLFIFVPLFFIYFFTSFYFLFCTTLTPLFILCLLLLFFPSILLSVLCHVPFVYMDFVFVSFYFFTSILSIFLPLLGSAFVHCYGTTKSFILKTHGSHDKITILLN